MKDYYKILGIGRDATTESIKQRFIELAFENHPDVSDKKDANEIFIEIYEAYHILRSQETKASYDLLYDKYLSGSKVEIHDEESVKSDYWVVTGSARETARQKAKMRYKEYIREMDCFFITGLIGNGRPYSYYMHRNIGISGGPGPLGSIKSKTVNIPIPRSRRALLMHRMGFLIKALFLALALLVFEPWFLPDRAILFKTAISVSVLLAGGLATLIFYQVNRTRSKFFFAGSHPLVKAYKKRGYKRGAHPMISTTQVGIISWLLRIIF